MMKVKKYLCGAIIGLVILVTLFGAGVGVVFIKKTIELDTLSKLKINDSPTVTYANLIPDNEEIFQWVKDLTDMGIRQPGTQAHQEAIDYVVTKFESFGLEDIHTDSADTTCWIANEWNLSVNGTQIDSYFMTHTFFTGGMGAFSTPEGGLNAEIVYVGDGKKSDFKNIDVKGKIVVANLEMSKVPIGFAKIASHLFYDPDNTLSIFSSRINPYSANNYPYNYYYALENGAVGFIGILSNYIDSNRFNNEDYSYIGGPMEIPGLWVCKSDGKQLVDLISKGNATATMTLVGERKIAQGSAVVAYLPGKSEETLLVHSHHDSSTIGGVEDASGTAAVIALAKFYSQIPFEEREKTIIFATMDTHFTGYDTHDAFIAKHLQGQDNILVDICVEHIALEVVEDKNGDITFTGQVEPRIIFISDSDALIKITKEEVVRHGLSRTTILPATLFGEEVPTDADLFYQEGIPIISLVSGPIYLYDNMDTIDMVAKDELRPTVETFADIIWRLFHLPAEEF